MTTDDNVYNLGKTIERAIKKIKKNGKPLVLYAPDVVSQIHMQDLLDEIAEEYEEVEKIIVKVRSVH
tara:strand:+ start:7190 stop:7390 length:201 start_codon:yes stop_codon:yes gene_type:complete